MKKMNPKNNPNLSFGTCNQSHRNFKSLTKQKFISFLFIALTTMFTGSTFAQTVWNNQNIGKTTISKPGTYTIKGNVKGTIFIKANNVIINGDGTFNGFMKTDPVQNCTIKNITVKSVGELPIQFKRSPGSKHNLIDNVTCYAHRPGVGKGQGGGMECSGGLITNSTYHVHDDAIRIMYPNTTVRNSTAVMTKNGAAIQLGWKANAQGSGHYAYDCVVKGSLGAHKNGGDHTVAPGRAILGGAPANGSDLRKVRVERLTVHGSNYAAVVRLIAYHYKGKAGHANDIVMTATMLDGIKKIDSKYSPILIKAINGGSIKNVYIELKDAKGNLINIPENWINIMGNVSNVTINGKDYKGGYNGSWSGGTGGGQNAAPQVSLTAPADVKVNTTVNLSATAKDSDGSVKSVEFFVDGESIAVDNSAPYSASFVASSEGNIVVKAVATDDKNAKGSDSKTIKIGSVSTTGITVTDVVTDCNKKKKARNIIYFSVTGSTAKPKVNRGTLLPDGKNWKIREVGVPFGSTLEYKITVGSNTKTVSVTAVGKGCKPANRQSKSAVSETATNALTVYPNPTSSVVNISLNVEDNVMIFNTQGKMVYSANNVKDLQLQKSELGEKGIYFVKTASGHTQSLIVE
ncbi:MAG: Ig-like domain-containing protein [Bacteroidales bacterium]|nr:Ig-like domain-containing protein [Bacteroidales bacterium]